MDRAVGWVDDMIALHFEGGGLEPDDKVAAWHRRFSIVSTSVYNTRGDNAPYETYYSFVPAFGCINRFWPYYDLQH